MAPTNPDLAKERQRASFDVDVMTYAIDGSIQKTRRRRYIRKLMYDDRNLEHAQMGYVSRQDAFMDMVRAQTHLVRKLQRLGIRDRDELDLAKRFALNNESGPLALHDLAFVSAFTLQADEEQKRDWLPRMLDHEIIGCYSQTELGHGSYVRGLETEAVYDSSTQEFVINSPTLTSTKYWSGNLGVMATHAIIMAQLTTQGKQRGVHPFLVQIRSLENHHLMPGVDAGDIGPKMHTNYTDNGFMRLDKVRVPRDRLLGRTGKVSADGTYTPPADPMLVYAGMLGIRAGIPLGSAYGLGKSITIAIRYSCVRRQSPINPGEAESQILDHETQQAKLFPWLATAYATWFASQALIQFYNDVKADMNDGRYDRLSELHAVSALLKTVVSWKGHEGTQMALLCCGGHGHLLASGIPQIYGKLLPATTAEGEHTVLLLQTARYLMKAFDSMRDDKPLHETVKYLANFRRAESMSFNGELDVDSLLTMMEYKAYNAIKSAWEKRQSPKKRGLNVLLTEAAWAQGELTIYKAFRDKVHQVATKQPDVGRVLRHLCMLYGINDVIKNAGVFLQHKYLSRQTLTQLRDEMFTLHDTIRPEAIALVDAMDHHDRDLNSILGRYDGNVYSNLLEWARSTPLNEEHIRGEVLKYIKPLTHAKL